MATKRKRASFSPTITAHSVTKKHEDKKEASVIQQVVEVVVEEPRENEEIVSVDEHDRNVESSFDVDQEETVRVKQSKPSLSEKELREELKEELRREMEEEKREEEEAEEKESIEEERKKSKAEENEDERQKETVAELFGKNSETIMPEITVHKNSNTRGLFIWGITMVAVAIGVGGGLVVFTNRSNQTPSTPISTPGGENVSQDTSPSEVQSPSPSPKPTTKPVVKKDIKIQVQNGGGIVGAGSKMKSFLEGKGYTVSDVGNASNYTYEDTDIVVKESKSDIRDTLEEDLSIEYSIGKVETTLPESSPYDARVIVGKN